MKSLHRHFLSAIAPAALFVAVIVIWQVCTKAFAVPEYLLPSPGTVALQLMHNAQNLLKHAAVTMIEAILGFSIANLVGFVVGTLCAHSKAAERALYPYAIALKTTPIVALAPILVLWLGTGISSKIAAAALICFFPIVVNATRGLRRVEEEAVDLFRMFGASNSAIFWKLRLPSSLPYVFAALKISTSLSIVGAIVGEFVGSQRGLGYLILVASYHIDTADLLAAVIVAAICGIAFFGVISALERTFVKWSEPA